MATSIKSVLVNVQGTHPQSRAQRSVFKRFDGLGQEVDPQGQPVKDAPILEGLNVATTTPPPFPQEAFNEAAKTGSYEKMNSISVAHAEQVAAWQKSTSGGTDELNIGRSVLNYLYKHHGFLPEDGDGYVIKMDNIDVQKNDLNDGSSLFVVSGTAVFGK